eukprot:CAMPEP_0172387432 /NCGR_PEP_ID=MMETSP1061-20121228/4730_1 /TAXON_ID=37318 /ORGANISM="Pseudo-nitzschia pungens, Strain cf. pungens" /LENGTH=578 /DNA_ID=CAMNT_0013117061 /DNA_START=362 /DNA_END=2098 /DNA_ORIENTATION=-
MASSPERTPTLPSTGGFRLQPRKNIPLHQTPPPARSFSSCSGRGRKRGAQTMVTMLHADSHLAAPKPLFASVSAALGNDDDDSRRLPGITFPSPRQYRGCTESPGSVHRAIQSMSIKSPAPSTPSSRPNIFRDRDTTSPFIVFSPSLKTCPYNTRNTRSESFSSIDSSTKAVASMQNTPRMASMYASPRRKPYGNNNNNNNNSELLSTPRSCSQTLNASQTPATPRSVRTLPSPHATPLPKSMRLTPRSRRHRDAFSNDPSIFLSPNEKLESASPRSECSLVFSFRGDIEPLQRRTSYVPSPYSCSRSSVASGRALGEMKSSDTDGKNDDEESSLRVETRSLLGPQDSNSVGDIMASANARSIALDCDKSLSDDENADYFVLANPSTLAQERDAQSMPPPRPSRRRRMSTDCNSESKAHTGEDYGESDCDSARHVHPISHTAARGQISQPTPKDGRRNKAFDRSREGHHEPVRKTKLSAMAIGRGSFDKLEPTERCCSLLGLGLAESSSMMDGNERPQTPPTMWNEFATSLPPTPSSRSSVSSVRISRSDANNVHRTIASMAAGHQQMSSPGLMTCNS